MKTCAKLRIVIVITRCHNEVSNEDKINFKKVLFMPGKYALSQGKLKKTVFSMVYNDKCFYSGCCPFG